MGGPVRAPEGCLGARWLEKIREQTKHVHDVASSRRSIIKELMPGVVQASVLDEDALRAAFDF